MGVDPWEGLVPTGYPMDGIPIGVGVMPITEPAGELDEIDGKDERDSGKPSKFGCGNANIVGFVGDCELADWRAGVWTVGEADDATGDRWGASCEAELEFKAPGVVKEGAESGDTSPFVPTDEMAAWVNPSPRRSPGAMRSSSISRIGRLCVPVFLCGLLLKNECERMIQGSVMFNHLDLSYDC